MTTKCKCREDAVVINPEGENVCVKCYKIYMRKRKYDGRQTSTQYIGGKAKTSGEEIRYSPARSKSYI